MPTRELLGWKIAQAATALLLSISLGLSTWTVKAVVDLREEVAVGRSARIALERSSEAFARDIAAIRTAMASLPQEAPPPWFKAQVADAFTRIDGQLMKITDRLESNGNRLAGIEFDVKSHIAATKP